MRGVSAVITATLLLLIAIAASAMFFSFMNRLKGEIQAEGESKMIELDVPPKLVSLICYDGYGYMLLSLSQGQGQVSGSTYYIVKLDTGKIVAEGFINITLQDSTKVYIPYLFDTSERYLVSLGGKRWEVSEYCRPFNDPHMVLNLPFDEGSGTTASDGSDYGNDGVLEGATWVLGKQKTALDFNGSQYAEVPSSESLNITDPFTVSMFIKFRNSSASSAPLIKGSGNPRYDNYLFYFDPNNDYLRFFIGMCNDTYPPYVTVIDNPDLNQWYYVSAVYNGTHSLSYVNATQVATTIIYYTPCENAFPVDIGYQWSNYFNGTIDEVRIYDRALSAEEIETLYNAYESGR